MARGKRRRPGCACPNKSGAADVGEQGEHDGPAKHKSTQAVSGTRRHCPDCIVQPAQARGGWTSCATSVGKQPSEWNSARSTKARGLYSQTPVSGQVRDVFGGECK